MTTNTLRSLLLSSLLLVTACASGPAERPESQGYSSAIYSAERILPEEVNDPQLDVYDPWMNMNKRIYNFNYHFDQKIFLPAVAGWNFIMPQIARKGLHNFFNNIRDVRTLVNSILQLDLDKTAQSTGCAGGHREAEATQSTGRAGHDSPTTPAALHRDLQGPLRWSTDSCAASQAA